jgi:hypothetical protein
MDESQQQIVERLKEANNVLVTTSSSPSVDQLAATIGLTLLLNKAGKHATAVFSGAVPSTLEFLEPEKTLEKNTDSLRDFIIALDKSKADKLRYKVEDSHVKIFITPYRTSISDKDLEFSQGDFNVELVVLLGVHDQKDLDQAITAHGRIFHDATVVSLAKTQGNNLGTINWVDPTASSLCEMLVSFTDQLKGGIDGQIATALMTGIVAETERFSNEKTTATTMANSARLMASGANQQLVATELQPKPVAPPAPEPAPIAAALEAAEAAAGQKPATEAAKPAEKPEAESTPDGSLRINHEEESKPASPPAPPVEEKEPEEDPLEQIHIDEDGSLHPIAEQEAKTEPIAMPQIETPPPSESSTSSIISSPPSLGGTLTANSQPASLEGGDTTADALSLPPIGGGKLLSHDAPIGAEETSADPLAPVKPTAGDKPEEKPAAEKRHTEQVHGHLTIQPPEHHDEPSLTELAKQEEPGADISPPTAQQVIDGSGQTLSQIENQLSSASVVEPEPLPPHVSEDQARDAVSDAVSESPQPLAPPAAFNAQPLDMAVQEHDDQSIPGLPPNLVPVEPAPQVDNTASPMGDPSAPPLMPPPMMPPPGFVQSPSGQPGTGQQQQ